MSIKFEGCTFGCFPTIKTCSADARDPAQSTWSLATILICKRPSLQRSHLIGDCLRYNLNFVKNGVVAFICTMGVTKRFD